MSFEFDKSTRHALRTLHADVPTSHYSSLTVHSPKTYPYVLLSKNKNILPLLAFGWKISRNLNRIVDKLPISVKICITLHA